MRHAIAILVVFSCVWQSTCTNSAQVSTTPPPFPIVKDLPSLVQNAEIVIVGKVNLVRPGRSAGEGETQLQFNDVLIKVEKRIKGEPAADVVVEQLSLERRGVTSEVGPAYEPGQRYVLFLHPGEGNRYVPIPQGRYFLRGGRVYPTEPGLVADKLKGWDEDRFIGVLEATVKGSESNSRLPRQP